jgi:tetratricopeptide (TPR) repeat protein
VSPSVRRLSGFLIVLLWCTSGLARAAGKPTFSKNIAPIMYERCASCHRPGEIGPFSLLSYSDVRQHLTQIADATRRRVMPPWKPSAPANEFVGDRSLSPEQIQQIQDWVAQGAPEGDRRDLPPLPLWSTGWQLGQPDLIVTMDAPYTLRPDGADVFRTFVLPIPTTAARYVKAVEFHPGNPRAVHHANIGIDRTKSSRRLDAADPEPGYVGGMVPDADYPAGYMLGWTPGQNARPSPDGMAWRLEPNSDLVVQLHLQPTGKPEPVQVSMGFFFTGDPPTRNPIGLRLGSETIAIAAGDAQYEIKDRYVLPVDVEVLAVQPHAHNLARLMEAAALLPDGTVRPLITIKDWDFRWQDVYRYSKPFILPRGTAISMRFTYDNSAANPRNPSQPPKAVEWGQNTTDEMGDLWLQVVPASKADFAILTADINRKTRTEDLAAYTKVLQSDPKNPLRHDAVAMLNLQLGHIAEAEAEFRESLRLNPESAPTHYNIGLIFSVQRKYEQAAAEFQNATRLDPNHAEAHNNLGAMLHAFGRLDEAAAEYRRAIALRPENAQALNNLGRLLTSQGQFAGAVGEFEKALALDPDSVVPLSGLAWVRAVAADPAVRQPDEAIRLAERAAALSNRKDPAALDALAASYAAARQFERAVNTGREAMQVADSLGMQALWVDIRSRVKLYEQQQPYIAR